MNKKDFEFETKKGELHLEKYTGTDEIVTIPENVKQISGIAFRGNSHIREVIIPDSVHTISSFAFDDCELLETVRLPKNLKEIPAYCFDMCKKLKNINLPESVEVIEEFAFRGCESLEIVKLPKNLVEVKEYAFANCFNIREIEFPENLKIIDKYAFNRCKSLTELYLNENIEKIGVNAFEVCLELRKIIVASPKTKILKNAIEVYDKIEEINFYAVKCLDIEKQFKFLNEYIENFDTLDYQKDLLTHIKKKTVKNAIMLSDYSQMIDFILKQKNQITLDDLDKYIENSIEKSNTEITAILLEYKDKNFTTEDIETKQTQDELVEIGLEYPTLKKLKDKWKCSKKDGGIRISAYIGNGENEVIPKQLADGTPIVTVGYSSNNGYAGIKKIIIEDGVLEIGEKAFYNCVDLQEIVIPNSVTKIGKTAFAQTNIVDITLPDGLKVINHGTFKNCKKLEKIVFPESVEVFDSLYTSNTFGTCISLKEVVLSSKIKEIPHSAFSNCVVLEKITFSKDLTRIHSDAFYNCANLERFDIDSAVKIGINAFFNCYKWADKYGVIVINNIVYCTCNVGKDVVIQDGVTIIEESGMAFSENIETITLPEGLLEIKKMAFRNCSKLTKINIPSSVKIICADAFFYTRIEEITIPKTTKLMKAFNNNDIIITRV